MSNYIKNGVVDRIGIAEDICSGKLDRSSVNQLISNSTITDSFLGSTYTKKISKEKWNASYLRELPNAAVADAFNEDYLIYLVEVYEYVNAQHSALDKEINFAKRNWVIIFIIMVVIGGIIYFFDLVSRKGGETKYGRK